MGIDLQIGKKKKVLEMDVVTAPNNVNYSVLDKGFT